MTRPELAVFCGPAQWSPENPPAAVQAVALLVCQASVVLPSSDTRFGVAVNEVTAGTGGAGVTTRVAVLGLLDPPGPVQTSVYVYVPAVAMGPIGVPVLDAA